MLAAIFNTEEDDTEIEVNKKGNKESVYHKSFESADKILRRI